MFIMEYTTRNTSVACECGGRHQQTPSIEQQHKNTRKHLTWVFQNLSLKLLEAAEKTEKVVILKDLKRVVLTGRVY